MKNPRAVKGLSYSATSPSAGPMLDFLDPSASRLRRSIARRRAASLHVHTRCVVPFTGDPPSAGGLTGFREHESLRLHLILSHTDWALPPVNTPLVREGRNMRRVRSLSTFRALSALVERGAMADDYGLIHALNFNVQVERSGSAFWCRSRILVAVLRLFASKRLSRHDHKLETRASPLFRRRDPSQVST